MRNIFARQSKQTPLNKSLTLKNPGPLQTFVRDLLGVQAGTISTPYKQSIWFYRCANIWSYISGVPWMVVNGDDEQVTTGAEAFLLESPNTRQSQCEIKELWALSMANYGNAFLLKNNGTYSGTGLPQYITPISAHRMSYESKDTDQITGYVNRWRLSLGNGKYTYIDADAVIHSMLPNPYNPSWGLAPIDALKITVDADYAARIHNKAQMKNHGRIAGVMSFKDRIGIDNLKLMRKMFDEKYAGNENAGATAFFDNDARYQQMSLSAKDMDWLEGQKISREEICAAFGIPPNVAGILDKATYSNYAQASKVLWQETLVPLGNKFTSSINRSLFKTSTNKTKLDFSTVPALQQDEKERAEIFQIYVNNKVSPARAAEIAGINLGDVVPAQNEVWINMGEVPASEYSQDETTDEPEKEIRIVERVVEKIVEVEVPSKKEMQFDLRLAQAKNIERDAVEYEKAIEKALKSYFYAQRKSVLKRAESVETMIKSVEQKIIDKTPKEMVLDWLSEKDWDKELMLKMTPFIYEISEKAAKRFLAEIGQNTDRFDQAMMQGFYKQQGILIRKINDTTFKALEKSAKTLLANAQAGVDIADTMTALKDDLRGVYNNTEARRRTIARTETLRTVNGARFEQMKLSGMPYKEWLAVMDSETRPDHVALDGQTVPTGHPFLISSTGEKIMYPLDPGASAGETINCRCVMIAQESAE